MSDLLSRLRRAVARYWSTPLVLIVVFASVGCTGLPIAIGGADATPVVREGASAIGPASATTPTPAAQRNATPQPSATGAAAKPKRAADEMAAITLGNPIAVDGSGASVNGSVVTITAGGTYRISGTLKEGQIVANTKDKKTLKLILDGVDVTCAASAPIYLKHAGPATIYLSDGTKNHLADGRAYVVDDPAADEPDATVFSKGNLTIDGGGSLAVDGNYRHAINSKGELTVAGGNVTVNAAKDGIRGRDYITVKNGNVTVNAKADGLQSNNNEDPQLGFVSIEGGTVNVNAGQDGIQAETNVVVKGGTVSIVAGGGSKSAAGSTPTPGSSNGGGQPSATPTPVDAKGIKAVSGVQIEGGTIDVDSPDDAIRSSGNIEIGDGKIVVASGDQGIHSDATLTVSGGDVTVTRSREALEGAVVAIDGGTVHLAATQNGVNASDASDRPPMDGKPQKNNSGPPIDKHMSITGGYVVVDSTGDGLDSNGWMKMTGGTVIVNGPVVGDEGALDYAREFTMAGGTLVAVGSSGMAQTPDATSTQLFFAVTLQSPQPAGTLVHIEAEDGTNLLTFAPIREFQSVIYSSPALRKGSTYSVYVGGKSTGSVKDGVYSGGTYTPGARVARPKV